MRHNFFLLALALIGLLSCGDDNNIENQEELITTVKYELEPRGGGAKVVLIFKDLDGDGGNAPEVMINDNLSKGTIYDGTLTLLNESESPVEDITLEVNEEAEAHQFFYQTSGQIAIAYNDTDNNGKPIGLKTVLTTANAGVGQSIKITLRHEPNKGASGVSTGNILNAGGETDIEVNFSLDVE